MAVRLPIIKRVRGVYTPPGDKSISHRALIFSSIADGESHLSNLAPGEDIKSTCQALRALGVHWEFKEEEGWVRGVGLHGLKEAHSPIDLKNSGTSLRLLTGLCAPQPFKTHFMGDRSLSRRPMEELLSYLREMGATIKTASGTCPIHIYPPRGPLSGKVFELKTPSAQVKSALLLAGLYAHGETVIIEPLKTRKHSEVLLQQMGAKLTVEGRKVSLKGPLDRLEPLDFLIPGDLSSAAYAVALAVLCPGSSLTIQTLERDRMRDGFIEILERMGATILWKDSRTLVARSSSLKGICVDETLSLRALDELPLVALVATQARGTTRVMGASSLRYKESNRLLAMVENLRALGARIAQEKEGWTIEGEKGLKGGSVKSYDDHRIMMTMTVAAALTPESVMIDSTDCVKVSYPLFFKDLENLCE